MTTTRKAHGGAKLGRTATVTIRLDPRLRYLTELAARTQRRTVSSFIEWVLEEALARVSLTEGISLRDQADLLWDVDEPDRFVRLAQHYPGLLTHDEQVRWKQLRASEEHRP